MKIQIASDLHMEHWRRDLPDPVDQFAPDEARDLLILAGDITDGKTDYGLPFIRRELDISPVIFVPGNHEYYYATKQKVDNWWRAFATYHPGFHYLNDETVEIGGLRFYGAEWCSDFWGDEQHYYFDRLISDFWLTKDWTTTRHEAEFRRTTESMKKLAGEVDVVITHFPPTLGALDLRLYKGKLTNPYFINDREWLVRHMSPKLWVSGHTHTPFDYQVGDTRVIGNPRGFREETAQPGFCPTRTVEV